MKIILILVSIAVANFSPLVESAAVAPAPAEALPGLRDLKEPNDNPFFDFILKELLPIFKSSRDNAQQSEFVFQNNPFARHVSILFGDEFKRFRTDVVAKLLDKQDLLTAVISAALNPDNWQVDPDAERYEDEDPLVLPAAPVGPPGTGPVGPPGPPGTGPVGPPGGAQVKGPGTTPGAAPSRKK